MVTDFDRSFDEARCHFPSSFLDNGFILFINMHFNVKKVSNTFDLVDLACCHNLSITMYIKTQYIKRVWGVTVDVCVCLEG